MRYIKESLLEDEKLVYQSQVHPFIYVLPAVIFFLGFVLAILFPYNLPKLILAAGFLLTFRAHLISISTELAITNKRVVAKFGFISRKTVELNMNQIESVSFEQSVFGRIFDFGSIAINGTGTGSAPIPGIEKPMEFKKQVQRQLDKR